MQTKIYSNYLTAIDNNYSDFSVLFSVSFRYVVHDLETRLSGFVRTMVYEGASNYTTFFKRKISAE